MYTAEQIAQATAARTRQEYEAIDALNQTGAKLLLKAPAKYAHDKANPRKDSKALREGIMTHVAVLEPERFAAFFARLLDLPAERPRTRFGAAAAYEARAAWATFLVHVFASLEDAMLRPHALRLVSLPMWETLTPTHLQQLLAAQPQLAKPWKGLSKRRDKEARMATPPASSRHEREFIPGLLRAFLRALAVAGGEATDELAVKEGDGGGGDGGGGDDGGGRLNSESRSAVLELALTVRYVSV